MSNKITKNELHSDIVQEIDNVQTITNKLASHETDGTTHTYYADDTGTANNKVLTIPGITTLKKGLSVAFTNLVANTGVVRVNVNGMDAGVLSSKGISLKSGDLKANIPYTIRYNGASFFLQGEGASGNAIASDLLSGKTAGTDAGDIVGTMVNRGSFRPAPIATQNQVVIIPQGYHDGTGQVTANYQAGKRKYFGSWTGQNSQISVNFGFTVGVIIVSNTYGTTSVRYKNAVNNEWGQTGNGDYTPAWGIAADTSASMYLYSNGGTYYVTAYEA